MANAVTEKPEELDHAMVLWLSLGQLISWGTLFYTFALLLEPLERELGAGRSAVALAFSLAMLTEGLMGYPVGRWIDRGHGRAVMCTGSALAALGLVALSFVQSLAGLYAAWFVIGLALPCVLYTPSFAILTQRFPTQFRRAIITLTFLGGLASTVFLPLGAWLIGHMGWRSALLVLAALHALVCLPIHAVVLRGLRAHAAAAVSGGVLPVPVVAKSDASIIAPSAKLIASNGHLAITFAPNFLKTPAFWYIATFIVLFMGVTASIPAHLVAMLGESGISSKQAIGFAASIGAVQVLGRVLMFFFESKFDVHTSNRVIPCLIPIGLLALLAASWGGALAGASGWLVLIFVAAYGMGNGMLTIVKGTAIAQYVNRDAVGRLNGLIALPTALARSAGALILAALWSPARGYTLGLACMVAACVVAVLALVLAQRGARAKASSLG
jgi:MFS family permease